MQHRAAREAIRHDRRQAHQCAARDLATREGISYTKLPCAVLLTVWRGGYPPGSRITLTDGRPAKVFGATWRQTGPPAAYWVRELKSIQYEPGVLTSVLNDETVPAVDCRPARPAPSAAA